MLSVSVFCFGWLDAWFYTAKLNKPTLHKQKPEVRLTVKLNKVDEAVIKTLKTEAKDLSLQELTDKTGLPGKKIFKSLRKLFEHNMVDTAARKYKLLRETPPSGKDEAEAETEEE
jgi:hypothetical protein